jgi:hypothetical protein
MEKEASMYRILRIFAVLAVAALMVLATLVPAVSAGSGDRPFEGTIVGGGAVVPDSTCPLGIRTVTWGSGELTHLGLATMSGSHCTPAFGAGIVGGVQTFEAANGDTLEMTYSATLAPFEPVEGAFMEGPGQTTIVGGTGRFAGATGEFVAYMRGILHFMAPMELAWSVSGEIGY